MHAADASGLAWTDGLGEKPQLGLKEWEWGVDQEEASAKVQKANPSRGGGAKLRDSNASRPSYHQGPKDFFRGGVSEGLATRPNDVTSKEETNAA